MTSQRPALFRAACRAILIVFAIESAYAYPPGMELPWQVKIRFGPTEAWGQLAPAAVTADAEPQDITDQITCIGADPFVADNLKCTPEADTTDPYIIEKAAELRGATDQETAENIFEFVRDEIAYEVYVGSLRGARGTLLSKAANSLDQASLMIALLRASAIGAEYLGGTLDALTAKERILSMFRPALRVAGCPLPGTERYAPTEDANLLSDASTHYWVAIGLGSAIATADPTGDDTELGSAPGVAESRFISVPRELRHRVKVQIAVEHASLFGLSETIPLTVSLFAGALAARPLTAGNFVRSDTEPGALIHTYSPYLSISPGPNASASDAESITGADVSEHYFPPFPAASTFLTAVFLDVELSSPSGEDFRYRRPIKDRIPFEIRQGGGSFAPQPAALDRPLLTPFDTATFLVLTGAEHPEIGVRVSLAESIAEIEDLLAHMRSGGDDRELGGLEPRLRKGLAEAASVQLLDYAAQSADLGLALANSFFALTYRDRPGLVLSANALEVDSSLDQVTFRATMDVARNAQRTVLRPGQVSRSEAFVNVMRGLADGFAEALVPGVASGAMTGTGILQAALERGISFVLLDEPTAEQLEAVAGLSGEARARIAKALSEGQMVFAPTEMVELNSVTTAGWLEIDASTGASTTVMEDGSHPTMLQYVGTALAGATWGAWLGVLGGFAIFDLMLLHMKLSATAEDPADRSAQKLALIASWRAAILPPATHIIHNIIVNTIGNAIPAGGLIGYLTSQFVRQKFQITSWKSVFQSFLPAIGTGTIFGLTTASAVFRGVVTALMDILQVQIENGHYDPPELGLLTSMDSFDSLPAPSAGAIEVDVVPDLTFVVPTPAGELPWAYRVRLGNGTSAPRKFSLSTSGLPDSVVGAFALDEIEVPAGSTAEIGFCVKPLEPVRSGELPFSVVISDAEGALADVPLAVSSPRLPLSDAFMAPSMVACSRSRSFSS